MSKTNKKQERNKNLEIKLGNLDLFHHSYTSQNKKNGAFKTYTLECSNCEALYYAPIISPAKQTVPAFSHTQITCDKKQSVSSSQEPDRYQWYKYESEPRGTELSKRSLHDEYEDNKQSYIIGSGPILEIFNVSSTDAGWYMCCFLDSSLAPEMRQLLIASSLNSTQIIDDVFKTCSSAQLIVNEHFLDKIQSPNSKVTVKSSLNTILAVVTSLALVSLALMTLFICVCHRRLKAYRNTQKAVGTMQKNEFYQNRDELNDESSYFDQVIDAKGEKINFEDILRVCISTDTR